VKTLKANKSNWSGEEFIVRVKNSGEFTIKGLDGRFQMRTKEDGILVATDEEGREYYGFPDGRYVVFAECGCITCDESEYVAFAQLMWNIR
jgi:hypothetical protein